MENILKSFIGGRLVSNEFLNYAKTRMEILDKKVYRGLPLTETALDVGYIIKEWHGSSHWSLDFNISRKIFANPKEFDITISEDYREELSEKYDISYEKTLDLFVPVIMEMEEPIPIFPTYKVTKEYKSLEPWTKEQEVTTIGFDFRITEVQEKEDSLGKYFRVKVQPIKHKLQRINLNF